jgi:deazaflavin-dependent oxidoreductase (nitroreductase family)
MRLRLPQGNMIVLAILRSPVHRLLSGLALELRYTGRRSGREYGLPVQYARAGDRLVLWPQDAENKQWWRNFGTPQPVTVHLEGEVHHGTATLVDRSDPGWDEARTVYVSRWRRFENRLTGPFVVVSLDSEEGTIA